MPGLVWFFLIGLASLAWFAPSTYTNITEKPKSVDVAKSPKQPASAPKPAPVIAAASAPALPSPPAPAASAPVLMGCASATKNKITMCKCYDDKGRSMEAPPGYCTDSTQPGPVVLTGYNLPDQGGRPSADPELDAEMVKWARNRPRFY